jgi:hypothetical protein
LTSNFPNSKIIVTNDIVSKGVGPKTTTAADRPNFVELKTAKQESAELERKLGEARTGPKTTPDDVIELEPGKKGGWNKELNGTLKPNEKYKVGSYLYETDDLGRVNKVSGKLELNKHDRNRYQQAKAGKTGGIKDGLEADEGGHLVASVFNGPGEQINYAAMNGKLNKSAWKQMENEWGKALKDGKKVDVDLRPVYEGGSKRPDKFIARYKIDGKLYKRRFKNYQ